MGRLTPAKLVYLVQKKERGWGSGRVAKDLKLTRQRVNQVWKAHRTDPAGFQLKRPGRPRKNLSGEELTKILDAYTRYRVSAVQLGRILRLEGTAINHNRIHRVLRGLQVAREEPKKQRRRKWVRYERPCSNDLWHTDWTQLGDGRWLILFEDDASRHVMGWGVYDGESAAASIEVFDRAVAEYGLPRQVLSDKGTVFFTNEKDGHKPGLSQFTTHLAELGVKHIQSRTNHPQTNGKLEKLNGTIKRAARVHFDGDLEKTIQWYNEVRPHMSLKLNRAETPSQAYRRKLPVEHVFTQTGAWIWGE